MNHHNKVQYIGAIAKFMPLGVLMRAVRQNIIFPFYHTVSDNPLIHIKHLYKVKSLKQFSLDLDYILRRYEPVSIEDILSGGLSAEGKYVHFSFDDGLKQCSEFIAPVLLDRGVGASFFVNPPFVGNSNWFYRYEQSVLFELLMQSSEHKHLVKNLLSVEDNINFRNRIWELLGQDKVSTMEDLNIYMDMKDLSVLSRMGFHIGAHSMKHQLFSSLSVDSQIQQISDSVNWVSSHFNQPTVSYSFPFSDDGVNASTIEKIRLGNNVSLSFGTSGLGVNKGLAHYQRIPMEHDMCFSAEQIIKGELLSHSIKRIVKG